MVFTRYSAGKIWSSNCVQDIVKPELLPVNNNINITKLI